jgi:hypothetical protein
MSAELRVRRVVLKARHRSYEWRFQRGVTVLAGPGSVGKTSLMNLIKWGFGGDAILSPAVRTIGLQVMVEVDLAEHHVGLLRSIDRGRNRVDVLDTSGEVQRTLSADPGDERRATVSDFLLESVGIPSVQVPRSAQAITDELTRITFNDVFSYMYLDQDEIARSTIHHIEGYRDIKRRQTFELLYGIMDSDVARIKREIATVAVARERLDADIGAIRPFLERSGQPTQHELDLRETKMASEIAVAEREIALLRRDARARGTSESHSRLSATEAELVRTRQQLAAARLEADAYRRVRSQLAQDLSRAVKAIVATPVFAGFEFEQCPRCLQPLTIDHPDGACRLCGQPDRESPDAAALNSERERIEAQIRETDGLIADSEARERALDIESDTLEAQFVAVREQIDIETRQAVSPYVDRMASVSARLGELRGAHSALEASRRYLAGMRRLQSERDRLRARAVELERELDAAEDGRSVALERVHDLSEIFAQILDELKLPWLREAHIDTTNYLPIVNGERLEALSSGSTKALVNTAYFLAGLTYAVRGYHTLLPRFLMIDSPRVHHGANATDRQAGERVYRWLMRLQQALNDKAAFLGGRGFQLLVADNDVPSLVRDLHTKRFSRQEPLLSDVPGLDDEQLLALLDGDEEPDA